MIKSINGALFGKKLFRLVLFGRARLGKFWIRFLTKDYLIQKNMLTEVMPGQGNSKSASYSIGDKFSSLLALKERLENEE